MVGRVTEIQEKKERVRFRTGTQWAFIGKAVGLLAGLGINMLLARFLAPDEMGTYFLALSMITVVAMVARFGTATAAVRLIAEAVGVGDADNARGIAEITLRFVLTTGLLLGMLLAMGGAELIGRVVFNNDLLGPVGVLVGLWAFFMTFQTSVAEIYRGFHEIKGAILFGGLLSSLIMLLVLLFYRLGGASLDLERVIQVIVVSLAVSAAGAVILLKRNSLVGTTDGGGIATAGLLKTAAPMFVTGSSMFVLAQVDVLILGANSTAEEVALYAAAKRFVLLVTISLQIISTVLPPMIAQLNKQDRRSELEDIMRSAATIAGVPSAMILVILMMAPGEVMKLVYGGFYEAGAKILVVLAIGQMVNVWSGSCGFALNMTGHHKILMLVSLCVGLLVLVGSIFGAKSFGGTGVAIVVAGGYVIQNLTLIIVTRLKLGIWTQMDFRLVKAIRIFMKP